ncbi:MAG TPA: hypothetical protein VJJ81_00370 [Candidatus Babeliales bacterium]|nr:hypothetical protein [Candidatus Babeliales bacterium]
MLKKINSFTENNRKIKNSSKLLILGLIAILQMGSPSFAGLCSSKPIAPATERRASAARRSVVAPAPLTSVSAQMLAGLEAYEREQRALTAAFMLGIQAGATAARVAAMTPAPTVATSDADARLVLGFGSRRLSSDDEAKEA